MVAVGILKKYQSYFTVFRVMTNICLSNDLPNSKVD